MNYDIGDRAKLRAAFTTRKLTLSEQKTWREQGTIPDGIGVDPGSVICTVLKPSGATLTPTASGSKGVWTAEVDVAEAGTWRYAFDGSEGFKASGENKLYVQDQLVPR